MSHLFTDDNPETTLKGLGFKTREKTIKSIKLIEDTFSNLKKNQQINTCSPLNLRPRYILDSQRAIEKFYLQQKMYRVLGLLNRAKTIYSRYPKDTLKESIQILKNWMNEYHKVIRKYKDIKLKKCLE
jgi:hypothetical protein